MAVVELHAKDETNEVLARAEAFVGFVAGLEPGTFTGSAAMVVAEALGRVHKAAGAGAARFAARVEAAGAHRGRGFGSSADWLAKTSGQSPGRARAQIELAEALDELPAVREAFVAGELSVEQTTEVARTVLADAASEAEMLDLARRRDLRGLKDAGRQKRQAGVDPEVIRARQVAKRDATWWREDDGMVAIKLLFPELEGMAVVNRMEAQAARRHRAARKAGDVTTTFGAHLADAYLGALGAEAGESTAARGPHHRAEVIVVADLGALRRGHGHHGEPVKLLGGGSLPVGVVHELIEGDALLKIALHDGVEVQAVKHLGRKKNLKAEVLTALTLGPPPDFAGPRCDEDGCSRSYRLQIEHRRAVINGGDTELANLGWRCPPDHWTKTQRDMEQRR